MYILTYAARQVHYLDTTETVVNDETVKLCSYFQLIEKESPCDVTAGRECHK